MALSVAPISVCGLVSGHLAPRGSAQPFPASLPSLHRLPTKIRVQMRRGRRGRDVKREALVVLWEGWRGRCQRSPGCWAVVALLSGSMLPVQRRFWRRGAFSSCCPEPCRIVRCGVRLHSCITFPALGDHVSGSGSTLRSEAQTGGITSIRSYVSFRSIQVFQTKK